MEQIFNNTEIAFSLKTDTELERAYFLFKLIANEPLVRMGTAVTRFALKVHLPIEELIRSTVFDHFCGGVNEEDCLKVVDKMFTKGVSSVLDFSVEGKEEEVQFEAATQMILKTIAFGKEKLAIPFAVFKPTGLGRFSLFEKKSSQVVLTKNEEEEWSRVVARFDLICKTSCDHNVPLLIDAEESWMQNAADDLILDMMRKYNKNKAIVYNTVQMYRLDRLEYLEKINAVALKEEFYLGIKLVRGAYLEKENDRANEKGYATPICSSKEITDANYDTAISYLLGNLDVFSLFIGTHNEKSCYLVMELMKQKNLQPSDFRIWFGQLYGMSDHISFNLAIKGYNVAKYLPFGPVKDVIPYLIRRAEENTSIAGQTNRELELIKKERARREKKQEV
ncbi:proline dehydrogenase family protein [Flavobacterium sp. UMI-01]|uniref:proline dehydrogenase family protein n=1 Tax=Flavobacterium sp. UMI-01 TaxID=1441053 RepID=UPI001C7D714E|nr:proline dehydrogenase family protein [Flavobacterium sp. UMI-01]GIZ08319.1 proline dehydrogenase [Flavobacterium sp. UMI-01]